MKKNHKILSRILTMSQVKNKQVYDGKILSEYLLNSRKQNSAGAFILSI